MLIEILQNPATFPLAALAGCAAAVLIMAACGVGDNRAKVRRNRKGR